MEMTVPKAGAKREPEMLDDIAAPREGGREVENKVQGEFFEFNEPGETLEGVLVATRQIKAKKNKPEDPDTVLRYLLEELDADGVVHTWILPSHYDLSGKLADIWESTGEGAHVWIGYLGRKKVEGVPSPMAFYKVVDYGVNQSFMEGRAGSRTAPAQESTPARTAAGASRPAATDGVSPETPDPDTSVTPPQQSNDRPLTAAERNGLITHARALGITDNDLLDIIRLHTGKIGTAGLTISERDSLKSILQKEAEAPF